MGSVAVTVARTPSDHALQNIVLVLGRVFYAATRGNSPRVEQDDPHDVEPHSGGQEQSTTVMQARAPRGPVPPNLRDVSFRTAVRGYERREVDRYVERANHLIAELEITRSPESAVRHALERVGEQTSGILQRARETADEIIHTARAEADDVLERTSAEARDILDAARTKADAVVADAEDEARERLADGDRELESARSEAVEARAEAEREVQALRAHAEVIAEERRRLVEEVRELAARLEAVADSGTPAAARVASATASATRDGKDAPEPTGVEVWHAQQSDG